MAQKKTNYADEFQPAFGIPWCEPRTDAELEAMDTESLRRYARARQIVETQGPINPIAAGWTMPSWNLIMDNWKKYNIHVLLGGNQSSKSTAGSRFSLWAAATIPESEVYAFHISEKRSVDDQQRFIYEALPTFIRDIPTKKGVAHSLQYTQKNGFTDGICILPPHPGFRRGGSIKFYNYAQYQQNDQIIEGIKAHFVWGDEKMPLALFETLRMGRLMTYHGRMLLTYTVIDGWNDTIEKILAKRKTVLTQFCDHPKIMANLPIMEESLSVGSCAIYYAWTKDNPFTDYKEFLKINANESKETILARGFGVPTKSVKGVFENFSRDINVIPHDKLPWLNLKKRARGQDIPYKTTRYMAIDPGGSKNWFMLWVAVDAGGTWWVYREWPDYDDWALPGKEGVGNPGPAQRGTKNGIKDYVELMREVEADETVFERWIDPRMGAAVRQGEDGATTIITDLDDAGLLPPVRPASGVDIDNGLQLIKNLLRWDTTKTRDAVNSPRLMVSDRCQNLIYAMAEYTNSGNPLEATKDCVDSLRYLAVSNIQYVEEVLKDDNRTGVY